MQEASTLRGYDQYHRLVDISRQFIGRIVHFNA